MRNTASGIGPTDFARHPSSIHIAPANVESISLLLSSCWKSIEWNSAVMYGSPAITLIYQYFVIRKRILCAVKSDVTVSRRPDHAGMNAALIWSPADVIARTTAALPDGKHVRRHFSALQWYPVGARRRVCKNQNDTKRQETFGHFFPHILIAAPDIILSSYIYVVLPPEQPHSFYITFTSRIRKSSTIISCNLREKRCAA